MASTTSVPPRPRPNPEHTNFPPSFHIMRVPTGQNSPRTDERCFTYCSQTVAGRHRGRAPTCKSLCFRRVFAHEVKTLVARVASDEKVTSAASILAVAKSGTTVEERSKQIPLPEEGQNPNAMFTRSTAAGVATSILPSAIASRPQSAVAARKEAKRAEKNGEEDKEKKKETKYWEEGLYVWYTNSKWHALDHMNMMMFSLERQAGWDRYRERMRGEWVRRYNALAASAANPGRKPAPSRSSEKATPEPEYVDVSEPLPTEFHPGRVRGPSSSTVGVPIYPALNGRSMLLPLPPPLPSVTTAVKNLLKPTEKLLDIFQRSWESGAQRKFAEKVWNKSVGDEWREPWKLLGKAWETVIKRSSEE